MLLNSKIYQFYCNFQDLLEPSSINELHHKYLAYCNFGSFLKPPPLLEGQPRDLLYYMPCYIYAYG